MKKIFNILILFALVLLYSCEYNNSDFDTDDLLTGTAVEGGSIVAVSSDTEGKLLGVPSSLDFETATVSFAEIELYMKVILMSGGNTISGYEITKSLNGGLEATVATNVTLPITLTYTTVDEFLDGLGISESDLRIGDVITFRTKMIRNDGSAVFAGPNDGSYNVTISCSSNLAGVYNKTITRDDGSQWLRPGEIVTEVGVGEYVSTTTGGWAPGAYGDSMGYNFTDVCGQLTVLEQQLFQGMFSNAVYGTDPGSVDGATGNLATTYAIDFSAGPSVYSEVYVKQ